MPKIIDLQELINFRAENKLKKDIAELSNLIRNNNLLNSSEEIPRLKFKNEHEKAPYFMFQESSNYMEELKAYWLPIYQNREAQVFLNTVDKIRNELDEVLEKTEFL